MSELDLGSGFMAFKVGIETDISVFGAIALALGYRHGLSTMMSPTISFAFSE